MGGTGDFTLNPAQFHQDRKDQAVRVDLPRVTKTKGLRDPTSGTKPGGTLHC
jgi:hypothetical protein